MNPLTRLVIGDCQVPGREVGSYVRGNKQEARVEAVLQRLTGVVRRRLYDGVVAWGALPDEGDGRAV